MDHDSEETKSTSEPVGSTLRDLLTFLPPEISLIILSFISSPYTLTIAESVSKDWYKLARDEELWRSLCRTWGFGIFQIRYNEDVSEIPYRTFFKKRYIIHKNWRTPNGGRRIAKHRSEISPSPTLNSFAMSPNYVTLGLSNSFIKIYSAHTGVLARTLVGHESGVWCLWIIEGGSNSCYAEANSSTCSSSFKTSTSSQPTDNSPPLQEAIGCDPDSKSECILNLKEDNVEDEFSKLDDPLDTTDSNARSSQGWGQPNAIIVSAGTDKKLIIWDAVSGQLIHALHGHTATIRMLVMVPSLPLAVTASRDRTLRLWDVRKGLCMGVMHGHTDSVRCLAWGPNRTKRKGRGMIVSGSYDGSCRIWDLDELTCTQVLLPSVAVRLPRIYAVAFDPSGRFVASGGADTSVRVWDVSSGRCIALLQGHSDMILALQFASFPASYRGVSRDTLLLFTASMRGCVVPFAITPPSPTYFALGNGDGYKFEKVAMSMTASSGSSDAQRTLPDPASARLASTPDLLHPSTLRSDPRVTAMQGYALQFRWCPGMGVLLSSDDTIGKINVWELVRKASCESGRDVEVERKWEMRYLRSFDIDVGVMGGGEMTYKMLFTPSMWAIGSSGFETTVLEIWRFDESN